MGIKKTKKAEVKRLKRLLLSGDARNKAWAEKILTEIENRQQEEKGRMKTPTKKP